MAWFKSKETPLREPRFSTMLLISLQLLVGCLFLVVLNFFILSESCSVNASVALISCGSLLLNPARQDHVVTTAHLYLTHNLTY